ncbi:MAG TPA: TIM barrel protein [Gemmatimonadota bacterium]|nr:TIM barrel protein [Gemmatimonadota bacterium]
MKLAAAPISWGVSEVPGWGVQLGPDRVLSQIVEAGLEATELGPRGFLPADAAAIRARLGPRGLALVGGFVPAVLHQAANRAPEFARLRESAALLADAGGAVLVLAALTGEAGYEAAYRPDASEWEILRGGIAEAQEIGARRGLDVAFHPHYGTVIEREVDVRRLLASTDVPLCLDTGHLLVAGADPLEVAQAAGARIAHVHLKDVDTALATRVRARELGYRDAVRAGLYRPLGEGDLDLGGLLEILRACGYDGWYVIEQDLVLEAGDDPGRPLADVRESLDFLRGLVAA